MTSKNSLYYGHFDGFKAPMVPKAPRSYRANSRKKSSVGSKLCAFELLAAVAADKLLQESESYTSSTIQEQKEEINNSIVKQEPEVKVKVNLKESLESDNDSGLEHVSDVKTCDFLSKVGNNVKLEPSDGKIVDKLVLVNGDLTFRDSCVNKMLTSRYKRVTSASKRRKLFHHNTSNKVKFSINSFQVPEIYIELPETATIASLKRTVMEAVRAIIGDELHVGILLEGKKVKDNNRTLQQTGISRNCDPENLGFILEPSFPQLSLPNDISQQPSSSAASPIKEVGYSNSCQYLVPQATSLENYVDKNQEIISLQNEVLTEERVTDSKALVAVDQVNHKPNKKYEVGQRRLRRPFSVSEVEAFVEAVETIGTGRWRDVKLRAFDVANHRTYLYYL